MGAAVSTVYYNLKLRHPALDMPIIDYDLVLLVQPMLMLGISIGVIFNVILADWMVTILLLILFLCNYINLKLFNSKFYYSSLKKKILCLLFKIWCGVVVLCIGSHIYKSISEGSCSLEEGNASSQNGLILYLSWLIIL